MSRELRARLPVLHPPGGHEGIRVRVWRAGRTPGLLEELRAGSLTSRGRTFNGLTEDEKRRLSDAVVAAVIETLREVDVADVVARLRPEDVAYFRRA